MMNLLQIQERIKQRPPFQMIERVIELTSNESARGIKNVSVNEPYFLGHFPGTPIMPGVLLIESAAQLCSLVIESDGSDPSFDRIAAAKAADKLLSVRGVDASFALVNIEGVIHISARSNGTVNVQLILEKMGGGGHFDAAAAAIKNGDMKSTLYRLKDAIDEYFKKN